MPENIEVANSWDAKRELESEYRERRHKETDLIKMRMRNPKLFHRGGDLFLFVELAILFVALTDEKIFTVVERKIVSIDEIISSWH